MAAARITDATRDPLLRSRRTIALDLKQPQAIVAVRRLAATCDGLIEGFRPGVMERLGLGPDLLIADNPRLVYGRMTGWGQTGPMAGDPGHDINYIAISGALHAYGEAGRRPVAPINMVGDFGGGGMMLAFGMLAAILQAQATGRGPGRRLRDDRRIGGADEHDLGNARDGPVERGARHQSARRRRAFL